MDLARQVEAYRREQKLRAAQIDSTERGILNQLESVQAELTRSSGSPVDHGTGARALSPRIVRDGHSSRLSNSRLRSKRARLADEEAVLLRQLEQLHMNYDPRMHASVHSSRSCSISPPLSRSTAPSQVDQVSRPLFSLTAQRQLQNVAEEFGREQQRICQEREQLEAERRIIQSSLANRSRPNPSHAGTMSRLLPHHDRSRMQSDASHRPVLPARQGALLEEIHQLRQSYLENGGRSSSFLRDLNAMEADARRVARQREPAHPAPESLSPATGAVNTVATDDPQLRWLQEQIRRCESQNRQLLASIQGVKVAPGGYHHLVRTPVEQERRLDGLRHQVAVATEELQLRRLQAQLQALQPQAPRVAGGAHDDLGPSPYDPKAGFAILWDFALGLPADDALVRCHLSVSLVKKGIPLSSSQPSPAVPCALADVDTLLSAQAGLDKAAVFQSEQPFPRLSPSTSAMLRIELLAGADAESVSGQSPQHSRPMAWTQVELFDQHHNLVSGRWKVPLRVPPVKKTVTVAGLNDIVQFHRCELFFRLINARDFAEHKTILLGPQQRHQYRYMPITSAPASQLHTAFASPKKSSPSKEKKKKTPASEKTKDGKPSRTAKWNPVRKRGPFGKAPALVESEESDDDMSILSAMSITPEPTPPNTPPPVVDEPEVVLDLLGTELWRLKGVGEGKVKLVISAVRPKGTVCRADGQDMVLDAMVGTDSFYKVEVQNFGKAHVKFSQAGLFQDAILLVEVHLQPYTGKPKSAAAAAAGGAGASKSTSANKPASESGSNQQSRSATTAAAKSSRRPSSPSAAADDAVQERRKSHSRQGHKLYDTERLVAWTFVKVFNDVPGQANADDAPGSIPSPVATVAEGAESSGDGERFNVNTALHNLPLYEAPVAKSELISEENRSTFTRHRQATLRLRMFSECYPSPELLPESDDSDLEDVELPKEIFILHDRPGPLTKRYRDGETITVFVDGARFLPDNVTVTRVSGRVLDKHYNPIGKELTSLPYLLSDIYHPHFVPADTDRAKLSSFTEKISCRLEIKEPEVPRTATLGIKLYTVDGYSKRIATVGYAMLKMFVTVPSGDQPSNDSASMKVALNEGYHQLRVYARQPSLREPLSEQLFKRNRFVPCASVLVRIVKSSSSANTLSATAANSAPATLSPQLSVAPKYTDGVYVSTACIPTRSEKHLFTALHKRSPLVTKSSIPLLGDASWSRVDRTDVEIAEFIKGKLSRSLDLEPYDLDLTYISKYRPEMGLLISVDEAANLPWKKASYAVVAFTPPGSFFTGEFHDSAKFTSKLDWSSPLNCPAWTDGLWMFRRRHLHFHLYAVIMLQSMDVSFRRNKLKIQLGSEQAWTAVPVFSDGYVFTDRYQLPLFHGRPSDNVLSALASSMPSGGDLLAMLKDVKRVKPIDGASVTVRIGDSRRREEIEDVKVLPENNWYLPEERRNRYTNRKADKKKMTSLVPAGETEESLDAKLVENFRQMLLNAMQSWKSK